jgi:hypothetical protein
MHNNTRKRRAVFFMFGDLGDADFGGFGVGAFSPEPSAADKDYFSLRRQSDGVWPFPHTEF